MRWGIAARATAHGIEGASARVAAERERDPSDRGERAALRAEVAEPSEDVKAETWRRIHDEGYGSLHLTGAAMDGFHWNVQRELLDPWVWEFFERLPEVFTERQNEFARAYFGNLFPHYRVERAVLDRSQALLTEIDERLPLLARSLREASDDLGAGDPLPGVRLLVSAEAPPRPRLFYGWYIVGAGFLTQFVMGLLLFHSFGTYVALMQADFGWNRTTFSIAFAVQRVESGVLGPIQGWVIDTYGPRRVMLVGMVTFASGFFVLSQVQSLWSFYLAFMLIAVGASLGSFLAVVVSLVNWFPRAPDAGAQHALAWLRRRRLGRRRPSRC